MQFEYLQGQILGVTHNRNKTVLRLDTDESEDAVDVVLPVLNLRLELDPQSTEVFQKLNDYVSYWTELIFDEDNNKFITVMFDDCSAPELRLDYVECQFSREDYTFDELKQKLSDCRARYNDYVELYNKEAAKWRKVVHVLENELRKELDRFERKGKFFSGSDKGERYEVGRKCYERALDILNRLQDNGAV